MSPAVSIQDEGILYASLRVIGETHKLRLNGNGASPKLVESGPGQEVRFYAFPYPHFLVTPSGIEIPVHNVASAIRAGAPIMDKVPRRTGSRIRGDGPEPRARVLRTEADVPKPMTPKALARRKAAELAKKKTARVESVPEEGRDDE